MKLLGTHVVSGAMHDSDDRYDPPRCHPETRTAILDRIDLWAASSERPILWLNGPAGAGKSAIAQTQAERWSRAGTLGASFFMQRTAAGRNNREHVIPTLAYQFAVQNSRVQAHVRKLLGSDPQVFERSPTAQFNRLIADALTEEDASPYYVIIIDGLDECSIPYNGQGHEEQQKQILEAIASICERNLQLRFLIASRPEVQIRSCFAHGTLLRLTEQLTLYGGPEALKDIALFLKCKFEDIRCIHSLDRPWPPPGTIGKLTNNSSGHFVYPSTIVRHLSSPRVDPEDSLARIMDVTLKAEVWDDPESQPLLDASRSGTKAGSQPLAQLDALYVHILQTVVTDIQSNTFCILHLLAYAGVVQVEYFKSSDRIAQVLAIEHSQVNAELIDLHSLLNIPVDPGSNITFHHASFSEFLGDPRRSASFWAGGPPPLPLQRKFLRKLSVDYYASHCPLEIPLDGLFYSLWTGLLTFPRLLRFRPGKIKGALFLFMSFLQFTLVSLRSNSLQDSVVKLSLQMINPYELILPPWKWIGPLAARNTRVIWLYFQFWYAAIRHGFRLYRHRSPWGSAPWWRRAQANDWPVILIALTFAKFMVLGFVHVSIIALRCFIMWGSQFFTLTPEIVYSLDLFQRAISFCSTTLSWTYLSDLISIIVLFVFWASKPE